MIEKQGNKWRYYELLNLYTALENKSKDAFMFRVFACNENTFFTVGSIEMDVDDLKTIIKQNVAFQIEIDYLDEYTLFCHIKRFSQPKRYEIKAEFTIDSWVQSITVQFSCDSLEYKKTILDNIEELIEADSRILATSIERIVDNAG